MATTHNPPLRAQYHPKSQLMYSVVLGLSSYGCHVTDAASFLIPLWEVPSHTAQAAPSIVHYSAFPAQHPVSICYGISFAI